MQTKSWRTNSPIFPISNSLKKMEITNLITLLNRARKHNLSVTNLTILTAVAEQERCTMTHLASVAECSTAAITGQMDSLADKGLLHRTTDPTDRRTIKAVLSDKGREVHGGSDPATRLRITTNQEPRTTPHPMKCYKCQTPTNGKDKAGKPLCSCCMLDLFKAKGVMPQMSSPPVLRLPSSVLRPTEAMGRRKRNAGP